MKSLVVILVRFVSYTSTLKAVSMGESMEREPLQPDFDNKTVNITAFSGESVILPCTVENKDKSHKLIWLNPRKTLISQDDSRFIDDSRISVERPKIRDWNLMIREVRYNDSGEYMCQINTAPIMIKRIFLFIKVAPEIIEYSADSRVYVKEGDTKDLVCNATGVPMPVVTWYKLSNGRFRDELLDAEGESTLQGEVLILHNITRYCDGKYECNADNGVPPMAFKVFEVTVLFPPEVRILSVRIGQELGKETILLCTVAASPQGEIIWKRNGRELLFQANKYKTMVYDGDRHDEKTLELNIFNIEKHDFGHYTCHASNTLGDDSETMVLYEYKTLTEPPYRTTTTPYRPVFPTNSDRRRITVPNYGVFPGNDPGRIVDKGHTSNYNSAMGGSSNIIQCDIQLVLQVFMLVIHIIT